MNLMRFLGLEKNNESVISGQKTFEQIRDPGETDNNREMKQHEINASDMAQSSQAPNPTPSEEAGISNDNILNLPSRKPSTARDYRNYGATRKEENPQEGLQFKGLLDDPTLKEFFAQNHWGYGNYDGATYRSHEQLELGKHAVVARFQNALSNYISKKQSHLTKLKATVFETQGVCRITTQQLELACEHVKEDIKSLMEQMELSKTRQGWVADALNRYEIGFVKGLRATIPFDHLL
jgi:hypothetical protein